MMKIKKQTIVFAIFSVLLVGSWGTYNLYNIFTMKSAPVAMMIHEPYAMSSSQVIIIKEEKQNNKIDWDNPLINGLIIPLGLYFGKKFIDKMFTNKEDSV